MVYMKSRWQISESLMAESRLVVKRFMHGTSQEIVVWRNIIEDAHMPLDAAALTFSGSGWYV
jgi:hypothetical protein